MIGLAGAWKRLSAIAAGFLSTKNPARGPGLFVVAPWGA